MLRRLGARPCAWAAPLSAVHVRTGRGIANCALCDEDVEDFGAHCQETAHVARFAVCQSLVSPEKHAAMLGQIWDHIRLDFAAVDEINLAKVARRRRRLTSTLLYLRDNKVLTHALPRHMGGTLQASRQFSTLVMAGQEHARFAVMDRVARLFPEVLGDELEAVVDMILRPAALDLLFDMLDAGKLVNWAGTAAEAQTVPPSLLGTTERAAVLLAVIGELRLFTAKEKPINVGVKAQADALVLNVLATHGLENTLSELLHHVLQRIVDEGTPVWCEFKEALAALSLRSDRPPPPPLSAAPGPAPPEPPLDAPGLPELSAAPLPLVRPAANPKCLWGDVSRGGVLETSVPQGAKGAAFAPPMPKLATKAKVKK